MLIWLIITYYEFNLNENCVLKRMYSHWSIAPGMGWGRWAEGVGGGGGGSIRSFCFCLMSSDAKRKGGLS